MKTRCPKCAKNNKDTKKDNLHIYPDKSSYCFSCGYYTKAPNTPQNMKYKLFSKLFKNNSEKILSETNSIKVEKLPDQPKEPEKEEISPQHSELIPSLSYSIPSNARLYLASKGIDAFFRAGNFFWNQQEQSLVYPIYSPSGVMTFACQKYFGENKNHPRYTTKGNYKSFYNIFGNPDEEILFIVEDYLSALRIANITNPVTKKPYASYPIFGSVLIKEHVRSLSAKYPGIILMLDPDKRKESIQIKEQYKHMFDYILIAYIQKDPKNYSTEHLSEYLASFYNGAKQALDRTYSETH